VHNPSELPDVSRIEKIEEPYIKAQVITKSGIHRCDHDALHREAGPAHQSDTTSPRTAWNSPLRCHLGEVVFDFYDKLKSISRGYASFDYHPIGFKESDLIKLDILLNSEKVDALSALIHRDHAVRAGPKDVQQAEGAAAAPAVRDPDAGRHRCKDRARETVKALRKDVTAKCYGGDISAASANCWRSRRKARSGCGSVGSVEIPQDRRSWRC
jgi:GTP-binding protein LepA